MSVQYGAMLDALNNHKNLTHFELRPLTFNTWQLAYRDKFTTPPAYSGACRGTLNDVVVEALARADALTPPKPPTKKVMARR